MGRNHLSKKSSEIITPVSAPISTPSRPATQISTLVAFITISIAGIAVFWSGLSSPLMDGDTSLIPVSPVILHAIQLSLAIAVSFLVFLFFRYTFRPIAALLLALVFLVHPINSQSVLGISAMMVPLSVGLGMLAVWLLLRFGSSKSLFAVTACLFLSLLSNITGLLFVGMSLLYLFWFNRERLWTFVKITTLPIAIAMALRIHNSAPVLSASTPMGTLSPTGRIMTTPAIITFYLVKFLAPLKLSTGYYWTYPKFSMAHVLVPLVIDILAVAAMVLGGRLVHKRLAPQYSITYLFFACWLALGLIITLPFMPIGMTVSETWFYFPMIGLLGTLGLIGMSLRLKTNASRATAAVILAGILLLGCRTAMRGTEWQSLEKRATYDVSASKEDFVAYNNLAAVAFAKEDYAKVKEFDQKSVAVFPTYRSYVQLGLAQSHLGSYDAAINSYHTATSYSQAPLAYEYVCENLLFSHKPEQAIQFVDAALKLYPRDSTLWTYYALLAADNHDTATASRAISNASQYGTIPSAISDGIASGQTFQLRLTNIAQTATIQ